MIDQKLHTFLTVIREGSYSKAAARLNMTQPAISHQIRQLEEEYAIKIFYFESRKMKLTKEGSLLEKYARKGLILEQAFQKELKSYKAGNRPFQIGLTPTAEDNLVPAVIARYCAAHENVRVSIITDTIKRIYEKLSTRSLDFAIIEGSLSDSDLERRLLSVNYLCLVVSPKHPYAGRDSVTLEDLKQIPLIMRPHSAGTRQLFEECLLANREKLKHFSIIMEIDNVSTLKALVMSNLGASVMAHSSCITESRHGQLKMIPIQDFDAHREINLVYHRDFGCPPIIDELCSIYEETQKTARQ